MKFDRLKIKFLYCMVLMGICTTITIPTPLLAQDDNPPEDDRLTELLEQCQDSDREAEARLEACDRAIERDENNFRLNNFRLNNFRLWVNRGFALSSLGQYQEARNSFTRGKEILATLQDEARLQRLDDAIASDRLTGEALDRMQEIRENVRDLQDNPDLLDEQLEEALAACRTRTEEAMQQMESLEENTTE